MLFSHIQISYMLLCRIENIAVNFLINLSCLFSFNGLNRLKILHIITKLNVFLFLFYSNKILLMFLQKLNFFKKFPKFLIKFQIVKKSHPNFDCNKLSSFLTNDRKALISSLKIINQFLSHILYYLKINASLLK